MDQLNVEGDLGRILRDFVAQLVALQANMESAKLSERVKAAYQRKRREGDLGEWGHRPVQLDPQMVEAKYGELRSLRKVARHFGVSHETVRAMLSKKAVSNPALKSR